jgi:hypothetical protein
MSRLTKSNQKFSIELKNKARNLYHRLVSHAHLFSPNHHVTNLKKKVVEKMNFIFVDCCNTQGYFAQSRFTTCMQFLHNKLHRNF